jgi:hypothetical protein
MSDVEDCFGLGLAFDKLEAIVLIIGGVNEERVPMFHHLLDWFFFLLDVLFTGLQGVRAVFASTW